MINVQVRVDEALRTQAQRVAEDLGMDLTTAIRIFLKQLVHDNALPFRPHADSFYSQQNIERLSRIYQETKEGRSVVKASLIED